MAHVETSILLPGNFIWAKLTHSKWWPAITISASACGHPMPKAGQSWIFWFGDHLISPVAYSQMRHFTSCFPEMYKIPSSKLRLKAIIEVLEILMSMTENSFSNNEDLIQWACQGFPNLVLKTVETLPSLVLKCLDDLKDQMEVDQESEDVDIEEMDDSSESLKNQLQSGMLNIKEICISCHGKSKTVDLEHPFFNAGLCSLCKVRIKETVFSVGKDGKNICCIICAEPGYLILCENVNCSKSYCHHCIKCYLGIEGAREIIKTSPWNCFFCVPSENNNSVLQIQNDCEKRVCSLVYSDCIPNPEVPDPSNADRRPMTVLSLFDGIGTGKLALNILGVTIEKYYAVEIDEDAMNVSRMNHGDSIVYLGDILSLTDDDIESLGPIDLVIGGSPCNDLSLVNPARKGLYDPEGTGCLFFDFFHVLSVVRKSNRGVFYLFENVASMRVRDRIIISSFFSQEPAVIDAKYFSPQTRSRFFWGNIPGLHSLSKIWTPNSDELKENLLSECIMPVKGRKAVGHYFPLVWEKKFPLGGVNILNEFFKSLSIPLKLVVQPCICDNLQVEKIRTVTTNRNSLMQNKDSLLPVAMNDKPDILWITELEKVFGFPLHYTDTGNIGIVKRRELLGKAWSVPVVKVIFQPLTHFFLCK